MNYIKSILIFFIAFFPIKISFAIDDDLFEIYETKTNQKITTWDVLINKLETSEIIIWGEEHNDSIGHLLQAELLSLLAASNHKAPLAFSMEMFQTDVQSIMDEYLAGWISEKNFKSEARAWNNYKDYAPMVDFCKNNNIKIVCANTPARYTNMVTRGQFAALDVLPQPTKKAYLPPFPLDTLTGRYAEKFLSI